MRIKLLLKGTSVHHEFGNEGSGGQSFLRYNWKPGITYKFLLHGQPGADSSTVYTAYFFAPERATWELVASFKRPHTHTYLKRFHSFLENFIPEQGDKTREVFFGNQWIHDKGGNWISLKKAIFTYDNTAARVTEWIYRRHYGRPVYLRTVADTIQCTNPLFSACLRVKYQK